MRRFAPWVLVLVVVVACGDGDGGDAIDAPTDAATDAPSGLLYSAHVCVVADLHARSACDGASRSGIAVRAGSGASALTGADGRVVLRTSTLLPEDLFTVADNRADLIPGVVSQGLGDGSIVDAAVPTRTAWEALLAASGVQPGAGRGAIALALPSGATVEPLAGAAAPRYPTRDGGWSTVGPADPLGLVVLLDVPAGTTTVVVRAGEREHRPSLAVRAGAVTFEDLSR